MILAGSEARTSLAFARSLTHNRIPYVFTTPRAQKGVASSSRLISRRVVVPSPTGEPELYADALATLAAETGARVVIPMTDDALSVTAEHRSVLEKNDAIVAAGPVDSVRNVLDKRAHLALARRLGVPCPAQFELEDPSDIPELIERLGLPLVLKNSVRGTAQGFQFKWLVAHDERELRALIAEHCVDGRYPLFQELVRGTVVGLYGFASRGDVSVLHQTLVTRRSLGENVYRATMPVDPVLERHVRDLTRELEWDGLAAFAFFVTPDGGAKYMEMNGRAWGSIGGTVHAGWDLPAWTVRYFVDGIAPEPTPIRLGSKATWRYGDLVHLLMVLRGRRWLVDYRDVTRLRAVLDYLASFRPGVYSDAFSLEDPLPELVEHLNGLRAVLGGVRLRLARRLRR